MINSRLLVFLQFLFLSLLFLPFLLIPFAYGWVGAFICMSLALKLLIWTARHNKLGNFNIVPEIKQNAELIHSGPYKFIRHPMYTSVLLVGLGALCYGFALFKILIFLALLVVMVIKAKKEERYWCEKSEAYSNYKENTKMFIPFII